MRKVKQVVLGLVAGVIIIPCLYGWVNNIVLLTHDTLTPITGMIVCRIAGIFAVPLGIIMGFIN